MKWQDGGVPKDSAQNHVTTRVGAREAEQGKTLKGSFQKTGGPGSRRRGGGGEEGAGGRTERREGGRGTQGRTQRRERGSRGRGQNILALIPEKVRVHKVGPGGLPARTVLSDADPVNIQGLKALFPAGKPAGTGVSPAGGSAGHG